MESVEKTAVEKNTNAARILPGTLVQVRSLEDILNTLDEAGTYEGLPFMPEMVPFCGKVFRVLQRADKTCVLGNGLRKLEGTVVLEGLRCDGSRHDGCQMTCALFWKEAWITTQIANPDAGPVTADPPVAEIGLKTRRDDQRYFCQATELVAATTRDLPWWDPVQYYVDVRSRTFSLSSLPGVFVDLLAKKMTALRRRYRGGSLGPKRDPKAETLGLRVGELVEVKSYNEILATLDRYGKLRGLGFTSDMIDFCGRRFRVAGRVQSLIEETTGKMRSVRDTVRLEGGICPHHRGCARNMYHLWREAWLRRVDAA